MSYYTSTSMTTTSSANYQEFLARKQEIDTIKSARTRTYGSWLWCLGLGAIGSVIQSCRTGNWKPTIVATCVAAPCIGLAAVDAGITFAVVPPITAAAMFTSKTSSSRQKLQIVDPREADAMLFDKGLI